jgi:hypothetical protein
LRKLSKTNRQFWKDYGTDPGVPSDNAMTTEQLIEAAIKTVQQMSPDEKAHFRAKLDRSLGIPLKTSNVNFQ